MKLALETIKDESQGLGQDPRILTSTLNGVRFPRVGDSIGVDEPVLPLSTSFTISFMVRLKKATCPTSGPNI